MALGRWQRFAPRYTHYVTQLVPILLEIENEQEVPRTVPSRIGTVARIASTKKPEITTGPLLGSGLKVCLISSRRPYLSGFS